MLYWYNTVPGYGRVGAFKQVQPGHILYVLGMCLSGLDAFFAWKKDKNCGQCTDRYPKFMLMEHNYVKNRVMWWKCNLVLINIQKHNLDHLYPSRLYTNL